MSNASLPVIDSIARGYERLLAAADPRVEDLLLMKSPVPVTVICLSYVYFVLSLGPRLMADRKPFNLRTVLLLYNAGQTVFSAVAFFISVKHWIKCHGWGFDCYPINYESNTPDDLMTIRLCHLYFLSKITELADTCFFVLKKKNNHISLLHVFHHVSMPFSVWVGVKFNPGGNLCFFGLPNLFVHIWMYLYYWMAALGPQYQKYIWWKRYITQMQLAQFGIVMLYFLIIAFKCNVNKKLLAWILIMDVAFVILFTDFYRKAYLRKNVSKVATIEKNGVEKVERLLTSYAEGSKHNINGFSSQKENFSMKKDL